MPNRLDLAGVVFGRLTALERGPVINEATTWRCQCSCGQIAVVRTNSLRKGDTKSCGCLMRETSSATAVQHKTTHGMRRTPEYSVWCGIKRRCNNPNEKCYPRYGGKGVKCLFSSFEEFLAEIGPRPSPKHQVDRIDCRDHYAPGNVRWVLPAQQQRNRSDARKITLDGVTKPLKDWCEERGLSYATVYLRIKRLGWTPERALSVGALS